MKVLKALDEKFELYVCIALMSAMTLLIFLQVVMRYCLGASLSWSEELARYIFIWLVYFGISYGARIQKHIKIEAALGLFPTKARPFVMIIGEILFLAFALFIVYSGFGLVLKQMVLGQQSPAMHIPMWFLYAAPPVGFLFTAIRQIQNIINDSKLLGRKNVKEGGEK